MSKLLNLAQELFTLLDASEQKEFLTTRIDTIDYEDCCGLVELIAARYSLATMILENTEIKKATLSEDYDACARLVSLINEYYDLTDIIIDSETLKESVLDGLAENMELSEYLGSWDKDDLLDYISNKYSRACVDTLIKNDVISDLGSYTKQDLLQHLLLVTPAEIILKSNEFRNFVMDSCQCLDMLLFKDKSQQVQELKDLAVNLQLVPDLVKILSPVKPRIKLNLDGTYQVIKSF